MSVTIMSLVYKAHFQDVTFVHKGKKKATGQEYEKTVRVMNFNLKSVCLALADHANDEGEGAYPAVKTLESKTELSHPTVIACLTAMKQEGILSRESKFSKWGTVNYTIQKDKIIEMGSWERQKREKPQSKAALLPDVKPLNPKSKAALPDSSLHPKPSFNINGDEIPNDLTAKWYTDHGLEVPADLKLAEMRKRNPPAGVEAKMFAGLPVDDSDLNPVLALEAAAIEAFERAFGIESKWNWYPAKDVDEKVWKEFRLYLVKLHQVDSECFKNYFEWASDKYARGAMTGLGIKRNPQDFPDSFNAYKASAMYSKKEPKKVGSKTPRATSSEPKGFEAARKFLAMHGES